MLEPFNKRPPREIFLLCTTQVRAIDYAEKSGASTHCETTR